MVNYQLCIHRNSTGQYFISYFKSKKEIMCRSKEEVKRYIGEMSSGLIRKIGNVPPVFTGFSGCFDIKEEIRKAYGTELNRNLK